MVTSKILFFLLSGILSLTSTVSGDITKCSRPCRENQKVMFKQAHTYVYHYRADSYSYVNVTNKQQQDAAYNSLKLSAEIQLHIMTPCYFVMEIYNASLQDIKDDEPNYYRSFSESLAKHEVRFHYHNGIIEELCVAKSEPDWVLNIKRGILSMLQFEMTNTTSNYTTVEKTIWGTCKTDYTSGELDGWKTLKRKRIYKDCLQWGGEETFRSDSFDQKYIEAIDLFKNTQVCKYVLGNMEQPVQVTCKERQKFHAHASKVNLAVSNITQHLDLDRVIIKQRESELAEGEFIHENITFKFVNKENTLDLSNLEEFIQHTNRMYESDFKDIMTLHSFNTLIRNATYDELMNLFKTFESQYQQHISTRYCDSKQLYLHLTMDGITADVRDVHNDVDNEVSARVGSDIQVFKTEMKDTRAFLMAGIVKHEPAEEEIEGDIDIGCVRADIKVFKTEGDGTKAFPMAGIVKREPAEKEIEYDVGHSVRYGDIDNGCVGNNIIFLKTEGNDTMSGIMKLEPVKEEVEGDVEFTVSKYVNSAIISSVKSEEDTNVPETSYRNAEMEINNSVHKQQYECNICMTKFSHESHLINHKLIHNREKPFVCNICKMDFSQMIDLKIHKRIHLKSHECNICMKTFSKVNNLNTHKRTHTDDKTFECNTCLKKFLKMSDLNRHKTIHAVETSFECDICVKKFNNMHNLNDHKRIHSGKKPFECNMCRKKFIKPSDLKRHQRTHTGEKPYECNICEKKFAYLSILRTHNRIHSGEKPFECNICMKKFSHVSNLKIHLRVHSKEKPFECNVCTKKFSNVQTLTGHKRIHTGEKPFNCTTCMKKFVKSSDLKRHQRSHSGEKPFECEICMKKFAHASHFKIHKRIHTGEKPFECNICTKKFNDLKNLNTHKRIHTGEKPFECNFCRKTFTDRSTLNKHKRIHIDKKHIVGDNPKETF